MAVVIPDKQLFRVDEVAALCSVHPNTVRRWIEEGKLQTVQIPSGRRRIARAVLVEALEAAPDGAGSIKWLGR